MKIIIVILLSVPLVGGCFRLTGNIHEYTQYWIGRNIQDKRELVIDSHSYASRIKWQEKTYTLDNGNWVYVQPDSPGCFVHWEVSQQGIIVGCRLEGNCR